MPDATTTRLLQLLRPDRAEEVRCAAALVLGELGGRDPQVGQALCDLLADPATAVRLQAESAVGKLRVEKALPALLGRVREGGPEAEAAARAAAALGAKGTHALQKLMHEVAPGLRQRIASALGAGGTASADTAAVDVLLDADPKVVDAAARSLIAKVPSLDAAHRRALAGRVLDLLGSRKDAARPHVSESALVRLLAALKDARAEPVFWDRVDPARPPEVRAAALQALGTLAPPEDRTRLRALLGAAADPDFRVAAPALMILKGLPADGKLWKEWLALFDAPDVAARRFALEKLGARDTPEVAAALLRQLDHPDRGLRDQALAAVAKLKAGRAALAQALLEAPTADQAWALARVQAPLVRDYAPKALQELFARACAHLEDGDRRADPLLFLLREADAAGLRDRLEERALALRKKKQYATALSYLRLLARDPACGDPTRLELAACGLKVGDHDLAAEARAADPTLHQFAGLLHRREIDLPAALEKTKWLEPEDLFYLGFHFVEGGREEKDFGRDLLRLVVRRSPRSKLAKDAQSKLRSQGLD